MDRGCVGIVMEEVENGLTREFPEGSRNGISDLLEPLGLASLDLPIRRKALKELGLLKGQPSQDPLSAHPLSASRISSTIALSFATSMRGSKSW